MMYYTSNNLVVRGIICAQIKNSSCGMLKLHLFWLYNYNRWCIDKTCTMLNPSTNGKDKRLTFNVLLSKWLFTSLLRKMTQGEIWYKSVW